MTALSTYAFSRARPRSGCLAEVEPHLITEPVYAVVKSPRTQPVRTPTSAVAHASGPAAAQAGAELGGASPQGMSTSEPGEIGEIPVVASTGLPSCVIDTDEPSPHPTEGATEPFVERRRSDRRSRWFSVATDKRAGGTTLLISGDLDAATAPTLTARVDEVVRIGGDIRLDLSNVTFLGSAGLAALVHAREATAEVGTSVELVVPGGHRVVRRALEVTGLSSLFQIVTPDDVAP